MVAGTIELEIQMVSMSSNLMGIMKLVLGRERINSDVSFFLSLFFIQIQLDNKLLKLYRII